MAKQFVFTGEYKKGDVFEYRGEWYTALTDTQHYSAKEIADLEDGWDVQVGPHECVARLATADERTLAGIVTPRAIAAGDRVKDKNTVIEVFYTVVEVLDSKYMKVQDKSGRIYRTPISSCKLVDE